MLFFLLPLHRDENQSIATLKITKNIQNIATKVLLSEAKELENIAHKIDDSFEECVMEIFKSKGRVIITGVGKSAIIANKIVATLNSTGTPSIFMHAADAIHGDLGIIQSNDIVICISKSGNTPEIKVLIPLIKRMNCRLVALVSDTKSYLAKQANYILNAEISEEACPNKLAPTSSTTAHMAMGDAIAVALMELGNFSDQDFAKYHPGGSLGKRLYLTVDDIVPNNEVPIVRFDTTFKEIILEISSKRLGATAVVDENKELVGVITDGDLRRTIEKSENFEQTKANDIMNPKPKFVKKGDFAVHALNTMQKNHISQVIVLDKLKIVGFVHLHDLLKEGII